MTAFTGISLLEDLDVQSLTTNAVVYGLAKINEQIQKSLAVYNAQVAEMMGDYSEPVTVQTIVFKTGEAISMVEVDEFGKARTSKVDGNWDVSFPVRKFIAGVGYSLDWLNRATVAEVSRKLMQLQIAHQKNIVRQMKVAMYNSSNVTFVDELFNGQTLTVRKFWNNDGATVPSNSSGSAFLTTHNHYVPTAGSSLVDSDLTNAVKLVTEHDVTSGLMIVIHGSDIAKLEALTKYKALSSALMVYTNDTVTRQTLDNSDLSNRCVGIWDGSIEVWVKPFAVQNYLLVIATNDPSGKALGYRQLPWANLQGLRINSSSTLEPLIADEGIALEGFGVQNRSAGAIINITTTSGSVWANPTIS